MTPLPADETLNITGLSPFYTPNSDFYRVDTALVVPQVAADTWQLRIHGMVDKPVTLTFGDLVRRPMIEHDVTLTCVSEAVGGGYIGNARWQGILLADVLRQAGIQSGADQIVMRDVNGMTIGVATEPVMDGRKSMLAVGMNGQLLPAGARLPGAGGGARAVRIRVRDQVGGRHGAHHLRRVQRLLGEARLVPAGADQDRIPHRRAEGPQHRGRGPGDDRRGRLGAAPRHRGRRGGRQRRLVRQRNSPPRTPSIPGASGTTSGTPPPGSTFSRYGPPTRPATPRPRWCTRPSRTVRPGTTPSGSPLPKPAAGAHPLCAPSARSSGPLAAALPAGRRSAGSSRAQRARRAESRSSSASRLCALTTASQYGHAAAMPPTSGR